MNMNDRSSNSSKRLDSFVWSGLMFPKSSGSIFSGISPEPREYLLIVLSKCPRFEKDVE